MLVYVAFEDGESFSISDNGVIKKAKGNPSVLVVRELKQEMFSFAITQKVKLFQCQDEREQCLEKLVRVLFPYCKSCKFQ
ncbi:hypothetical protein HS1genome_2256 [Sulfodiicoccus acidiphilus]|uniref:Uncharacterized protein n=1 Tax=Sulfodiicoccus acidiphilus TaxID=1670455 RepID=A0A348B6R5_9CREN|nr:hypothetical protein [Sulfodiicoccus acidiphilus]BBD73867.1 hypothetical protein HS1genome_2256 [Sulfodiicoccus acidiphilus]GGT96224.1 hypothetical protein GCM10007116_12200 [Sulfodiicoccus acidiphilus]